MLQNEYDSQMQRAYGLGRNQAEYAALRSELNTNTEILDTLRRKLQQAAVDTEVGGLNTSVVQLAHTPSQATGPKKPLVLGGSFLLGAFAAAASLVVFEATSDRVRRISQIESTLGLPVLATVPTVPAASAESLSTNGGKVVRGAPLVLREPASPFSEAIRCVRDAAVLFGDPKIVLIASSGPGEGAPTLAANLSVTLAQADMRVLLVDTNITNPALHLEFGLDNGVGLGEFLEQEMIKPRVVAAASGLSSLWMVSAGNAAPAAAGGLASAAFRTLLSEWAQEYDYVLISCAPLLHASSSLLLAHRADATVLVVRHGVSRLSDLKKSRDMLQRSNARVRGVVLNDYPRDSRGQGSLDWHEVAAHA